MIGVFTVIVIQVKRYYYKVSEKQYADKMQEQLFKIQNGLNDPDLLELKQKMKDLDENPRLQGNDSKDTKNPFMTPTDIVQKVNTKIDSGVSKVKEFSGDVYEEYMKPVVYKIQKMMGW
jgi:uncharacterized protein YpmB